MTPTQMARRSDALYADGTRGMTRRMLCDMVAQRESDIEDARAENAKLRELVRDMMRYHFMPSTIDSKQRETELIERANELGVEKDYGEMGEEEE